MGHLRVLSPKALTTKEIEQTMSESEYLYLGAYLFTSSSRTIPRRIEKLLGYRTEAPSL